MVLLNSIWPPLQEEGREEAGRLLLCGGAEEGILARRLNDPSLSQEERAEPPSPPLLSSLRHHNPLVRKPNL